MSNLTLIIPAAGRGSRFKKNGITTPKPLIELNSRPFFWWATESIRQKTSIHELIFVVLEEHVIQFNIDSEIKFYYPNAKIVVISEVTKGAAETALLAIDAMESNGAFAINDCDHAFNLNNVNEIISDLSSEADAALVYFNSNNPAYSYAQLDQNNKVIGTVEKEVVSHCAIAGCYFFKDKETYINAYNQYIKNCNYNEYFISGIYNELARESKSISIFELESHCAFGTPEEYQTATDIISLYSHWIK